MAQLLDHLTRVKNFGLNPIGGLAKNPYLLTDRGTPRLAGIYYNANVNLRPFLHERPIVKEKE